MYDVGICVLYVCEREKEGRRDSACVWGSEVNLKCMRLSHLRQSLVLHGSTHQVSCPPPSFWASLDCFLSGFRSAKVTVGCSIQLYMGLHPPARMFLLLSFLMSKWEELWGLSVVERLLVPRSKDKENSKGTGKWRGKKEEGNQQNAAFTPKGIKDDLFWGQEWESVTQEQRFSSPGYHAPTRKQFHKVFIVAK